MTSTEAREELFVIIKTVWDAQARAIVDDPNHNPPIDYLPELYWQGREYASPPIQGLAYGRVHVIHSERKQSGFGRGNKKLYTCNGLIIVESFGPTSSGKGLTIAEGLANIAKDAYEGRSSPGGIWFRNCRINEIGPENGWFQINMQAEFTYDEVR